MCGDLSSKLGSLNFIMENEIQKQNKRIFSGGSILLELAASDDLDAFRREVEGKGLDINEVASWYGRKIGSRKMGLEERTPLLIAAMFASAKIMEYIIETGKVDVNRAYGSDKATALHCAAAGGSIDSTEVMKLLLDASADANCVDSNGNKPVDLIAARVMKLLPNSRRKAMEMLLNGCYSSGEGARSIEQIENLQKLTGSMVVKDGIERKEYSLDVALPDINNGIYGTDEFRMYIFKVKPCSRAYTHDWTECPFAHPGENAKRRDPKKYPYSCVPCPEFRKGACQKGDACEYAHGVFESWLHPAQYRTRLCKDEIGCARKVCFFAHKPEELRPVYASTGSALPSPRSHSVSGSEMEALSPLALGSSTLSLSVPATSTLPMSPLAPVSSPMSGSLWQNKVTLTPPTLQLPGSRLKASSSARDLDFEMELLSLENRTKQQQQQQQQYQHLVDEISRLSSPSYWNNDFRSGELKQINYGDILGSLDSPMLSQFQGLSQKLSTPTQLQTRPQTSQGMNQLRSSYPAKLSSSPARKPSPFGLDSSAAVASAVMNSRSSAFSKRSQSFIDRAAPAQVSSHTASSNLSSWGSPDGKLDWSVQGDDLKKLTKSASFGFKTRGPGPQSTLDEPDVSWVNSLVKDVPSEKSGLFYADTSAHSLEKKSREFLPSWGEQLYIEQEQMVA